VTVVDSPLVPGGLSLRDLQRLGELADALSCDVNEFDISLGHQMTAEWCPISLAVRRLLDALGITYRAVVVGTSEVVITVDDDSPPVVYAHDANRWVKDFDWGCVVEPRTVALRRTA
jgi:hypothetical protein